ncbi:MAG: pilus assembly protein [Bryobacterales bacterium]|nr:pilus assembly protein [Bryobacterales bacterium]
MANLTASARPLGLSPKNARRSGNAIIEGVFTILPTFALIFGFLDFGLVLYHWATLQNAVREGCRYAITFQTANNAGQDASIEAVVQQYAMGLVTTADSPQHIFVKYYSTSNLNTPIASGGNVPGNIVEVSVQNVSWAWIAPLSGSFGGGVPFFRDLTPITLNVYSSDILGGYPAGVNTVQE